MTRVPEQMHQSPGSQARLNRCSAPPTEGNGFEAWLRASGAPQTALHRCACQCRFRWPADAKRVEAHWGTGAVGRVIELARCPACRAACLRVLERAHSPSIDFSQPASVEQTREGAVSSLAAALVKTSGGDISREEAWAPALHAARHTVEAIADFILSSQRTPETSTHDVVQQRLHATQSTALLDILKLDRTLEDAVQSLALLAVASNELQVLARRIGLPPTSEDRQRVAELNERASRLGSYAAEVLLELSSLRQEVLGWKTETVPNSTGGGHP